MNEVHSVLIFIVHNISAILNISYFASAHVFIYVGVSVKIK